MMTALHCTENCHYSPQISTFLVSIKVEYNLLLSYGELIFFSFSPVKSVFISCFKLSFIARRVH